MVGGGPAGCAFAILAARAGASVVLVERDDYRQVRPGEHLAGRVRPMLDALVCRRTTAERRSGSEPGHSLDVERRRVVVEAVRRDAASRTGLCVLRHRFDELLCRSAREAGATVIARGKPVRVERRPVVRVGRHHRGRATAVPTVWWSAPSSTPAGGARVSHAGAGLAASTTAT